MGEYIKIMSWMRAFLLCLQRQLGTKINWRESCSFSSWVNFLQRGRLGRRFLLTWSTPLLAMYSSLRSMGLLTSSSNSTANPQGEASDVGKPLSLAPKRLQRFRAFASIEYRGVEYMSPQDFLDSLTLDEPRERVFRRMVDDATIGWMLKNTPTLHTGGSKKTFRTLGPNGIISYAEYLFILTLLTKSRDSFIVAFLMFDEDDDMRINKNEFLKVDEHQEEANAHSATVDTTILIHLFGQDGKKNLSFDEFQIFYTNLQRELIEIEFEEFALGKGTISTTDFARLVLRYSTLHKNDQSPYLQRVNERANNMEGITLEQFRQFSMFLNNLEDFTKAVRLYTVADIPVSRGEFIRAVKCSTGFELDPHLVDALFCIFDANNDDRLSYSEFIAIMNDRLNRGFKSLSGKHATLGWKPLKNCVVNELAAFRH